MPLHLIKLCVGTDRSPTSKTGSSSSSREKKRGVKKPERIHTTRMVPKRADELTGGGSIFWVIRGQVLCREKFSTSAPSPIRTASAAAADPRSEMRAGRPRPFRAFQGWRYLDHKERRPISTGPRPGLQNAGADAPRIARTRAALDTNIVDQPGAADPGGDEQPQAVLEVAGASVSA